MQQLIEFAGNHMFLVGSLILLTVLVVVNEVRLRAGGLQVGPADAVRLINDGAVVLDVRSPGKFDAGHIVGARNVPLDELDGRLETLQKHRERPVLVCCELGQTGTKAAAKLRQASFSQVYNLRGGLVGWQRDSLPLAKEAKKKTKKKDR